MCKPDFTFYRIKLLIWQNLIPQNSFLINDGKELVDWSKTANELASNQIAMAQESEVTVLHSESEFQKFHPELPKNHIFSVYSTSTSEFIPRCHKTVDDALLNEFNMQKAGPEGVLLRKNENSPNQMVVANSQYVEVQISNDKFYFTLSKYKEIIKSICGKLDFLHFERTNGTLGFHVNQECILTQKEKSLIEIEYDLVFNMNVGCLRMGIGAVVLSYNTEIFSLPSYRGYKFNCIERLHKFGDNTDKMDENSRTTCRATMSLIVLPDGSVRLKREMHSETNVHMDGHNLHEIYKPVNNQKKC